MKKVVASFVLTLARSIIVSGGVAIGADILKNKSYFNGDIDDVVISSRASDENDIQCIYQSWLTGKTFRKQYDGSKGLEDFAAFASFWLKTNTGPMPLLHRLVTILSPDIAETPMYSMSLACLV